MCAEVTDGQSAYLFHSSHKFFGLEPMAIIFSLPWALLMWSYVIFCLPRRCTRFTSIKFLLGDRMVIFFIALLLFCFSISNVPTRIFVAMMSVLMAALIGWGVWTAWESEEDEGSVGKEPGCVPAHTRCPIQARKETYFISHPPCPSPG